MDGYTHHEEQLPTYKKPTGIQSVVLRFEQRVVKGLPDLVIIHRPRDPFRAGTCSPSRHVLPRMRRAFH